jgi:hypothetical protein
MPVRESSSVMLPRLANETYMATSLLKDLCLDDCARRRGWFLFGVHHRGWKSEKTILCE